MNIIAAAYNPFTGPELQGYPSCRTCGRVPLEGHLATCMDLNGAVAEAVFGWQRWKMLGNLHGANKHGDVMIQPPDLEDTFAGKPDWWERTDEFPLHHPVTPMFDRDWAQAMQIRNVMARDDVHWQQFMAHLDSLVGPDEIEPWRSAHPRQVCYAALYAVYAVAHPKELETANVG